MLVDERKLPQLPTFPSSSPTLGCRHHWRSVLLLIFYKCARGSRLRHLWVKVPCIENGNMNELWTVQTALKPHLKKGGQRHQSRCQFQLPHSSHLFQGSNFGLNVLWLLAFRQGWCGSCWASPWTFKSKERNIYPFIRFIHIADIEPTKWIFV